jgi:hypothetical protein
MLAKAVRQRLKFDGNQPRFPVITANLRIDPVFSCDACLLLEIG